VSRRSTSSQGVEALIMNGRLARDLPPSPFHYEALNITEGFGVERLPLINSSNVTPDLTRGHQVQFFCTQNDERSTRSVTQLIKIDPLS